MKNKMIIKGKLNDCDRNNDISYNSISKNPFKNRQNNNKKEKSINEDKLKNNIWNSLNSINKNNLILSSILLLILVSGIAFAVPDSLTLQGKLTNLA
ncbi:MAG: hypothetical protein AABX74_03690, partial [Nanoarchaeota archaeon]